MADMHRPGRISRDIFDIDLGAAADGDPAESLALGHCRGQDARPDLGLYREVDEAGTGNVHLGDIRHGGEPRRDLLGKVTRLHAGILRQDHGRVGGEVAMGRITRGFHHDAVKRGLRQDDAVGGERGDRRTHVLGEESEDVHADDLMGGGRL